MSAQVLKVIIEDGAPVLCCSPSADLPLHVGDKCIIEREGVQEMAAVAAFLDIATPLPSDQTWRIVRRATLQDMARAKEISIRSHLAIRIVRDAVAKHKLPIRMVRIRYSFDQKALHVIYASETRIDCSAVVQEVAAELRTPVDMKPIGVRDEAAIIGGMGPCGRALCCCLWLRKFNAVNVRMAKTQGIAPNPAVITGMCGRLKCCLQYEQQVYEALEKGFPREGTVVETPEGQGVVIDKNTLACSLKVRLDSGGVASFEKNQVSPVQRSVGSVTAPHAGADAKESQSVRTK